MSLLKVYNINSSDNNLYIKLIQVSATVFWNKFNAFCNIININVLDEFSDYCIGLRPGRYFIVGNCLQDFKEPGQVKPGLVPRPPTFDGVITKALQIKGR